MVSTIDGDADPPASPSHGVERRRRRCPPSPFPTRLARRDTVTARRDPCTVPSSYVADVLAEPGYATAKRRDVTGFRSTSCGAAVSRRRGHRRDHRRPRRTRVVPATRRSAAPDVRRPGGDRDRERPPVHGTRARNRDLTEALEQQTATSEILRAISSSPTDVQPVFDIIAATRGEALRRRGRGGLAARRHEHRARRDRRARARRRKDGTHSSSRRRRTRRPPSARGHSGHGGGPYRGRARRPQLCAQGSLRTPPVTVAGWPYPSSATSRRSGRSLSGGAQPGLFPDNQVALLQTFADQAVIAIENVRLFKELEARTTQLTRSVGELKALGEVGQAVSSTLDLETVLRTIASRATEARGHGRRLRSTSTTRSARRSICTRPTGCRASSSTRCVPRPSRRAKAPLGRLAVTGRAGGDPRHHRRRNLSEPGPRDPHPARLSIAAGGAAPARGPPARRTGRQPEERRRLRAGGGRSAEDLRDTVGAGHPERPALPGDRGEGPAARGREPAQERVPRQHVARAAHAAQCDHRILGGSRPSGCSARSTTSRPSTWPTSSNREGICSPSSTTSSTCPRSRPDGWSWSWRTSASRGRSTTR